MREYRVPIVTAPGSVGLRQDCPGAHSLYVVSGVPISIEIAFGSQDAPRFPLAKGQFYHPDEPFDKFFLFFTDTLAGEEIRAVVLNSPEAEIRPGALESLEAIPGDTTSAVSVAEEDTAAAAVGLNTWLVAYPGPTVKLTIRQLVINNTDAAARTFSIRTAAVSSLTNLVAELAFRRIGGKPLNESRTSKLAEKTHATAGSGIGFSQLVIPAQDSKIYDLNPPVVIYGDDSGGQLGLGVVCNTQNLGFECGFLGEEAPL